MRHRIAIERPAHRLNDDDAMVRYWESLAANIPASITSEPIGKSQQGDIREEYSRFKIVTRFRDGIDNTMRIWWNGRRLYVRHVSDPDNRRRELVIQANAYNFEPVSLVRGQSSTNVQAFRAQHTNVTADMTGEHTVTGNAVDWIFDAVDFAIGGEPASPAYGDRITPAVGGGTFAAQPLGGELWRYEDSSRTFIRVHTIEVPS